MTDELRWRRIDKLWARISTLPAPEREATIQREAKNDKDRETLLEWSAIEGELPSGFAEPDSALHIDE